LTIKYKGHKGILGFNLGNTSILGNKFLVQNPDYDFFMDLNSRGTFSLRSADRLDVSKMAQDIAGGGGHKNASGGKIDGFRESFIYADIKEFVEDFINKKR
jgi:oligoribonuclease NrnB/cAMP/cGMP phosphodiesterase (DHH superfamily)